MQDYILGDAEPVGVDQCFVAVPDEAVFDWAAVRDRTARDATTRLFQRLKPAAERRIGVLWRRCTALRPEYSKKSDKNDGSGATTHRFIRPKIGPQGHSLCPSGEAREGCNW